MNTEPQIGSPRQSVSRWLEEFANANDEAADESFWPWTRAGYRGRAAAYPAFPITVEPGESVTLGITLTK